MIQPLEVDCHAISAREASSTEKPEERRLRKQYHFRRSRHGLLAWDIDRLIELSKDLEPIDIPLSEIRELDETFSFDAEGDTPTCRRIADHAKLILETDLTHPIILSQCGRVMDGMHRVCRALLEGRRTIQAIRFKNDPEPDHVGVAPDKLPYRIGVLRRWNECGLAPEHVTGTSDDQTPRSGRRPHEGRRAA